MGTGIAAMSTTHPYEKQGSRLKKSKKVARKKRKRKASSNRR